MLTYGMGKMRKGQSRVALAVSHSDSLRTTIPSHIVLGLRLGQGDNVVWDLDKVGNEWVATVRKVIPAD